VALNRLIGVFLDYTAVNETLDRLDAVTLVDIDKIIDAHPVSWLPTATRDAIRTWWVSAARTDRLTSVRKGIADGTYL
jgi:hypothetical protein